MPRAVVLVNPAARLGRVVRVDRLLRPFYDAGWTAECWAGHGPDWVLSAARRAVNEELDAVFVGGGDGSISAALPALVDTRTALGVVPLGTGNVWARTLALPLRSVDAIAAQLATSPRCIDVGRANGRLFLVVASAGVDAAIVKGVEAGLKPLGQMAYPLVGLGLARQLRGVGASVWVDGELAWEGPALAAIVTNGPLYGGMVNLVPGATFEDGLLDLVVFAGAGPLDAAAHVGRVLAGQHLEHDGVEHWQARTFSVEPEVRDWPVEVDGDPAGAGRLAVEVQPACLPVLGLQPAV